MDRRRYRDHLEVLRQASPRFESSRGRAWSNVDSASNADEFAAFSANDFRRRARLHPDVAWEDACHAYALAAATHPDLGGRLDLNTEMQLEAHWQHLRGDSDLEWTMARTLLRETWRWLDEQSDQGSTGNTLH